MCAPDCGGLLLDVLPCRYQPDVQVHSAREEFDDLAGPFLGRSRIALQKLLGARAPCGIGVSGIEQTQLPPRLKTHLLSDGQARVKAAPASRQTAI
jgi:hypothetical protein